MIFDKFILKRVAAYNKLKNYDLGTRILNDGLREKCYEEIVCYDYDGFYDRPCRVVDVLDHIEYYTYRQLLKTIAIIKKYIELDGSIRED